MRTKKAKTAASSKRRWMASKRKSSVAKRKTASFQGKNRSSQKLSQRVSNSLVLLEKRMTELMRAMRSITPREPHALAKKKRQTTTKKPKKSEATVSVDQSASMLSTSVSELSTTTTTTNMDSTAFFSALSASSTSSPKLVSRPTVSSPEHVSRPNSHSSSKQSVDGKSKFKESEMDVQSSPAPVVDKSSSRSPQTVPARKSNSVEDNNLENKPTYASIERSIDGDKESLKHSKSVKEKSLSKSPEKKASSLEEVSLDSRSMDILPQPTSVEDILEAITEQGEDPISPRKSDSDLKTITSSRSTSQAVLMSASLSAHKSKSEKNRLSLSTEPTRDNSLSHY